MPSRRVDRGGPHVIHRGSFVRGACALALGLCVLTAGDVPQASQPRVKVLALHFAMRNAPAIAAVDKALRDALGKAFPDRLHYESEYVDTAGFSDEAYQSAFRRYLQSRYGKTPPDLVIGTTQAVVPFLSQSPSLFDGVPIAYVSRNAVPDLDDAAGIISGFDFGGTLRVIQRLQPDTTDVYVVAGSSPPELNYVEWLREHRKDFTGTLAFHELTGLPLPELREKVRSLPARSVIYYLSLFEDREGRSYAATDAADAISKAANVPVYSWHEGFFGHGIVGGLLHSSVKDAEKLAGVAVRILNGEAPGAIAPLSVDSRVLEFDDRQMRRWSLAAARLPAGSTVAFRQPSIFELYGTYAFAGALLFAAQVALIAGLLVQRTKRRRVETALLEATERNSAILRVLPDLMFVLDRDGTYLDYYARDRNDLFAPPEAFLGRKVIDIMPPELSARFSDALARVNDSPDPVVVEYQLEMHGEVRYYEARHVARHDGHVLCIVRDVTEAQRAIELNRTLAGRLITSQEDERRRIARELHDDVAQRLSLLAVDLGVLNREADDRPAEIHQRLHALARQAAALGSDLQRVSHELHPAILEQVGLEMAVRGVCNDLSSLRHIVVDVRIEPLPPLPPTVSLGFYRVVQEALQNVARHSHASLVTVNLGVCGRGLCLRIVDDGVGFDSDAVQHGSLGLTSMQERMRLIGGRLDIAARLGHGTTVEASVPLG